MLEQLLRFHFGADVVAVDHDRLHGGLFEQVGVCRLDPAPGSVLVSQAVAGDHDPAWLLDESREARLEPGSVRGVDRLEQGAPQQLRRGVAEQPNGGRADVGERPIPLL